jgi:tRNA-Thr(GGU) m(6)t(6)A37 methyltransferase TsaA
LKVKPIGVIHSPFQQATGTPIQPCAAKGAEGAVEVSNEFVPGLKDLAGFERIWLLYWFDRAALEVSGLVIKPYLDTTPRGVFATRAPARPNPVGLSPVRLLKIRGNILIIRDVDILDGTPLLDVFTQFLMPSRHVNLRKKARHCERIPSAVEVKRPAPPAGAI